MTVDQVIAAATALADAEGLDAVTMRRVASRLGVVPMTLYTYMPGKAELLDLMLDAAYQEMPRADTTGQPWQQRVTAIAAENRALFQAHPWAAAISTTRPPLGPGLMAKYEHELAAFDGLGLDGIQMDAALTHLLTFVQAWAQAAASAQAERGESAMDDETVVGSPYAPAAQSPRPCRLPAGCPRRNRRRHRPSSCLQPPVRLLLRPADPSSAASPRSSAPTAQMAVLARTADRNEA